MIVLLSPAKTMEFSRGGLPDPSADWTVPSFLSKAEQLAVSLGDTPPDELAKRLKISVAITEKTVSEYHRWNAEDHRHPSGDVRAAIYAFRGAVFQTLDPKTLDPRVIRQAQDGPWKLRIFSALYGVLRPLDLVMAHRLEADTPVYRFWGETVAEALLEENDPLIVNLASQEFSRLADLKRLEREGRRVVTPVFQEEHAGRRKVVAIHAKRQRGKMTRWIIQNGPADEGSLHSYSADGYHLRRELSCPGQPVYVRRQGVVS